LPATLGQALPRGSDTAQPYEVAPGSRTGKSTRRIALVGAAGIAAGTLVAAGLGLWAVTQKRAATPPAPVVSVTAPIAERPPPPAEDPVTPALAVTAPPPAPSASASAQVHRRPGATTSASSPLPAAPRPHEPRPDSGGTEHGVFVDKPPF